MVTSMLEKAIEIEGLLRIIRDGDPLPETYKLLNAKTASLAMEATSLAVEAENRLKNEQETKAETPKVDFVMAAPAPEAETPKVDFTAPVDAPDEQPLIIKKESATILTSTTPDLTEVDLDLAEEDDILLSFDDVPEQVSITEEAPMTQAPDIELPIPAAEEIISVDTPEEYSETWNSTEGEDEPEKSAESPEEPESPSGEDEESSEQQPTLHQEPTGATEAPKRQTKLKAAFSLNDRFLYARELFNGNMKIFDSTLEFIEGIDDYSLVEDYFYSELEWDPENANVASFMEILRPQFKE